MEHGCEGTISRETHEIVRETVNVSTDLSSGGAPASDFLSHGAADKMHSAEFDVHVGYNCVHTRKRIGIYLYVYTNVYVYIIYICMLVYIYITIYTHLIAMKNMCQYAHMHCKHNAT